jgi:hypothetical protein
MCVNNIKTIAAMFPFSTGKSDAVVAMDVLHADLHYNKLLSENNCRRARI